jgi:hypothetical protein
VECFIKTHYGNVYETFFGHDAAGNGYAMGTGPQMVYGTQSSAPVIIRTNGAQRINIDAAGKIGMGTVVFDDGAGVHTIGNTGLPVVLGGGYFPEANLPNSCFSVQIDEGGNRLFFRVKYANGTVKFGSLAIA